MNGTGEPRPTVPATGVAARHVHASEIALPAVGEVPEGAGEIRRLPVWSDGGQSHGIWQMTPGVLERVEGPESVCILSGSAEVTVSPSGEQYLLAPGDVFVIGHGESAKWVVNETIRKFYVVNR